MANTSDIKNGLCIVMNNGIWKIVEFQHVKPGKGPAFVRTKLKNLKTGKVVDNTIPAGHKIETARIERRKFQFLYKDNMGCNFMNNENYEQITIEEKTIDNSGFLSEGMNVDILYHAEKEEILNVELPQFIIVEISQTDPGLKGDTATNATKKATIDTGAVLNVPLFINEGDKIKIDTTTGSYVERAK